MVDLVCSPSDRESVQNTDARFRGPSRAVLVMAPDVLAVASDSNYPLDTGR